MDAPWRKEGVPVKVVPEDLVKLRARQSKPIRNRSLQQWWLRLA